MKPEAKKIERPLEKDYFEYRGDQIIIDYGHATNFIDAQNEYINQLASERDELKARFKISEVCDENEKIKQELQTLKDAMNKFSHTLKTLTK